MRQQTSSKRGAALEAALAIYGLLVAGVLYGYFHKYPIPEFWMKLAAVFSAAWLAYAMHAVGRGAVWLCGWLKPISWIESTGPWNARLLRGGLGFAFVSFTVILLGWAVPGPLQTDLRVVFAALAAASLLSVGLRRPPKRGRVTLVPLALALLPAAGAVVSFLSSFSPITHYDSLVYHLALPSVYLRMGKIDSLPFNLYSAFPGGCEAVYTFVLGVLPAPEYAINVFGWILAATLGGAMAEWAGQLSGRRAGWLAGALWWTMPPVLLLSQGAYVDIPLAAATFLAIRSFAAWITDPDAEAGLLFAAFFCGLAGSIKYTGAITEFILLAALVLIVGRRAGGLRTIAAFVLIALLLPAPWLLKNLVTLGNPVFPFLYRWIGGKVGWTSVTASGSFRVLTEYTGKSNLLVDLITPWKSSGARGGFDVLGDFGWPLLLVGALPALFVAARRELRLLWIYFFLHAIVWYVSKPVLRFLIPAMPVAVILTAASLSRFSTRGPATRAAAGILTLAWIASNVFLYGLAASELKLFDVPFGSVSADDFLRRRLAFYPTFEAVNEASKPGETVLLIGEQRTYHLKVPFLSSNLFAPSPVSDLCNGAASPDDVTAFLFANHVTRVIVNEAEIERLGGLRRFGFDERGELTLRTFLASRTRRVSSDRGVDLYEIGAPVSVGKRP